MAALRPSPVPQGDDVGGGRVADRDAVGDVSRQRRDVGVVFGVDGCLLVGQVVVERRPCGRGDRRLDRGAGSDREREGVVGLVAARDLRDGVVDRRLHIGHVDQPFDLELGRRRSADRVDRVRVPGQHRLRRHRDGFVRRRRGHRQRCHGSQRENHGKDARQSAVSRRFRRLSCSFSARSAEVAAESALEDAKHGASLPCSENRVVLGEAREPCSRTVPSIPGVTVDLDEREISAASARSRRWRAVRSSISGCSADPREGERSISPTKRRLPGRPRFAFGGARTKIMRSNPRLAMRRAAMCRSPFRSSVTARSTSSTRQGLSRTSSSAGRCRNLPTT